MMNRWKNLVADRAIRDAARGLVACDLRALKKAMPQGDWPNLAKGAARHGLGQARANPGKLAALVAGAAVLGGLLWHRHARAQDRKAQASAKDQAASAPPQEQGDAPGPIAATIGHPAPGPATPPAATELPPGEAANR